MLVIVPFAFGRAGVADPRAELQHLAKHVLVRPGPAQAKPGRRLAYAQAWASGK